MFVYVMSTSARKCFEYEIKKNVSFENIYTVYYYRASIKTNLISNGANRYKICTK